MSKSATKSKAVQSKTTETKHGDFIPVSGSTGTTLYVLQRKADHPESMNFLSDAALRPLTYQELLPLLMRDEQLKNALKGKWFWLAGQVMKKDGIFTINEKGELRKITEEEKLSIEQKVRVRHGEQQLSFDVNPDDVAADYGRRFLLCAIDELQSVAPVVVGVPVVREAVAQKYVDLAELARKTLPSVIAALEPSANAKILSDLKRLQRAASE